MEPLNNREIAILIWAAIAIIGFLFSKAIRVSLGEVIKHTFSLQIMRIFLLMWCYIGIWVYLFYRLDLWELKLLKETLIWLLFVGTVMLFHVNQYAENKAEFRKTIRDVFKITIVVEFLRAHFTFSLTTEMIGIPLLVLLGGLLAVTGKEASYAGLQRLLNRLVVLWRFR